MRLKLPHLDPIRFAQDLINLTETTCRVSVKFPYPPTLAMIVESAAQSSAGFANKELRSPDVAFLVMLKNVKLEQKCEVINLEIFLNVEQQMGKITYFSFKAKDQEKSIAVGAFSIATS